VGVGVGDVPCLPHQVLEVLPADPGAQVLNGHAVIGPHRRSILVKPRGLGVTPPPGRSIPVPTGSFSMLNRDTIAQQFLAVKLIDGIVRVPVVLKLNESKVLLQQHVGGAAELTEELLQVPLSGPGGHVADIHSTATTAHFHFLSLSILL